MKLFKLTPKDGEWVPWYDKCFGLVIRAEDECQAREIAAEHGGDEEIMEYRWEAKGSSVWKNSEVTICEELANEGPVGLILRDFKSA